MACDVFISYSFDDQEIVDEITDYLEKKGISCFVAARDIPPGEKWAKYIPPAIENCKMMVYVHSETANKSDDIDNEIALCLKYKHPILPFKISDTKYTEAKEYHLVGINWIDAFQNSKECFEDLLTTIQDILKREEEKIRLEREKRLQEENKRLKEENERLKKDNERIKRELERLERELERSKKQLNQLEKAQQESKVEREAAQRAIEEATVKREAEEKAAEKAKEKRAEEAKTKRMAEEKATPKAIVIGSITAFVLFLLFIVISKFINSKEQNHTEQDPIEQNPTEQNGNIQNPIVQNPKIQELMNNMALVQGGVFSMGCTNEQGSDCWDDEKPAHQVTVSSFYIGKYEVTQAQWKAVMGNDKDSSYFKGDNLPVEQVRWSEVQEFIRKLNEQTGKHYRLPTEAEWEFAARGGIKSNGHKYSGSNTVDIVTWHKGNSKGITHHVGEKQANELGLYDMSGNVWEWCNDWYDKDYYQNKSTVNPAGPDTPGSKRVIRGGSWYSNARNARVSCRYYFDPADRGYNIGFRLASGSN